MIGSRYHLALQQLHRASRVACLLAPLAFFLTACLKTTYSDSQCQLEVSFRYGQLEGVEAVDGTLRLIDLNTSREYSVAVVGGGSVRMVIDRGFYRVFFEGYARSKGRMARVVSVVDEQEAVGSVQDVTLEVLSQWI